MNVLIPGGCGYVGSALTGRLLGAGHRVTVYDTICLSASDIGRLTLIKADVRDGTAFKAACDGQDAVIWLASISNNDVCEKEPELAYDVNIRAMFAAPRIARDAGVKRFIYASSVAGYPALDEPCTEKVALGHPTLYALGKLCAEGSLRGQFANWTIVRSASVVGDSPNPRYDTTINMMVRDAVQKGVITVNGGKQKRSHIHMEDICDFYRLLLDLPLEKSAAQIFNAVAENQTVLESAQLVASIVQGTRIEVRERSDDRSYCVDGTKAREVLGFKPRRTIAAGVREIKERLLDVA